MRSCFVLPLALATLACAAPAQAQPQPQSSSGQIARQQGVNQDDHHFLDYAAQDNQAEIQICLVAEKQASSPAVKAFARLMVNDHVEVESRLGSLVGALGVSSPNDRGKEGDQTMSKLEPLHGAEFDRAFMQAQIEDHTSDIRKFEQEVQNTQNEGIRRFGSETLDILNQHLALAKAVQQFGTH